MIIGNPYKFAIILEVIEEWNLEGDSTFYNGLLILCIEGELFPREILTATLGAEIYPLLEKLKKPARNDIFFNIEKEKAFVKMYDITFPEWDVECDKEGDIYNDYRYFISPTTLSDFGCHIYTVSNGEQIRIMAANLNYILEESTHDLNNLEISETFITCSELKRIINELDTFLNNCGLK